MVRQFQINRFFRHMRNARENNLKTFMHCWLGRDRSRFFSTVYELKYGLYDLQTCINELIKVAHTQGLNSWVIPKVREFAKKLKQH